MISFHAYAKKHLVEDYLRLGWMISMRGGLPSLQEVGHGEWSMLVEWLCQCRPVVPLVADGRPIVRHILKVEWEYVDGHGDIKLPVPTWP